ncbi:hypothetical protein GCM10009733_018200 [Nonomuraea maheshkhaliensis]|uniref:HTH araC/xylS-type domain-containing protein n=1 Tax=Nonomuraea maheshkhaliensis TaxID=419590 RepID=A0ABN2EYC9_9ACTN
MAILIGGMHIFRLDGYVVVPERPSFSLGSDTYESWSMLLPWTGAFCYEVDDVGGTRLSGEARFGDVVISPPGGTLRREMKEPTSFFFARFRTVLKPPIGGSSLQDVDRLRANLSLLESHEDLDDDMVTAHVVNDVLIAVHGKRTHEDALVREATAFILENFTSPDLSLGDLARMLGVSPSLLTRRFRDVRGVTPVAYLRGVRLRKARELLAGTDFTLQNIAEQCGYRSAFYFSRVFKKSTGRSPSGYRAEGGSVRPGQHPHHRDMQPRPRATG